MALNLVRAPVKVVKATTVPEEMVKELEEAWAHIVKNPEYECEYEATSAKDGAMYLARAKAWAGSREKGKLTVRKLQRKNEKNPEWIYFSISIFDPNKPKPGRKPGQSHATRASKA